MKTYPAKENPPLPEQRIFPMEVRHQMSASTVVYEGRNRGATIYTISHSSVEQTNHLEFIG
jgi:hypothetical protein